MIGYLAGQNVLILLCLTDMRVLLLSQLYLPEPDIKVHLLGRDLTWRGHGVTVVTRHSRN